MKSKTCEPREVPLTRACAAALRAQASRLGVLSKRFKRIAARAQLPDLVLHDLRHRLACRLRETVAPNQVIASLCGHKSLSTTMRYSRHMATDSLRNAIAAMEGPGDDVAPGEPPVAAAGS